MGQINDWGKLTMVILLVDSDQKVLDWEAKRLAESQGARYCVPAQQRKERDRFRKK